LTAVRQAAVEPLLAFFEQMLEKDRALAAVCMLVSYLHGFLTMELAKSVRFGVNTDEAFRHGLSKMIGCLLTESNEYG